MSKVNVTYTTEIITKNQEVNPQGCNSIHFENIGTTDATLDNTIPIGYSDAPRIFKNESPDEVITRSFKLIFAAASVRQVLVIRTFKKREVCK